MSGKTGATAPDETEPGPSRRGFLRRLGGGLLLPAMASLVPAAALVTPLAQALAAVPVRALQLTNRALGEEVRTVYFADGGYDKQGLAEIRRIFRDKRNDSEIDIDPALIDLLWAMQRRLPSRPPIEVVCGYRCPATNAQLRRTRRGVAANSYHMYGKAVDLRVPGLPIGLLHRAALDLEGGGVGYYPRSNFIHMDTGPVRTWGQGGGRGRSETIKAKRSGTASKSRSSTRRSVKISRAEGIRSTTARKPPRKG